MTHLFIDLPTWAANVSHTSNLLHSLHWHVSDDWIVLAQQFKETDITGDVGKTWNQFVRTGQVWALLIGLVVGYLARALTSYG